MTIFFLTNGIFRTAGTERVIVQLAKALKNVVIIVPGKTECAFSDYKDLNIISANIGDFPKAGKLAKIQHRLEYYNKLKRIIKSNANVVVISFAFDLNIVNIRLSKILNYRSIICEHIEYNYHSGLRNFIRKFTYRQKGVDLVCLTETDKLKFEQDGINAVAIPNFIHPINHSYKPNSKKILSIGRLEYQKNFGFLIDSFSCSKLYEKGWTLTIVGEGTEKQVLEEKIKRMNLGDFIKIHGFTNDIKLYYQNADLMCMTSRFEAFPMVLLEALNYGLPVLVTDFPTGAKEILGYENKQIVNEYNIEKFAQKMINFCNDDMLMLELSDLNHKLIHRYYPEEIMEAWRKLLQ